MRLLRLLFVSVSLVGITAVARAELKPPLQPGDESLFRLYQEKGAQALTKEQRDRLIFLVLYDANRTVMHQMHRGAIVAESFNGPELSLSAREEVTAKGKRSVPVDGEWRIWNTDHGITVKQEHGVLSIIGKSSIEGGLNFNGIVGRTYGTTDVVAIARMKTVKPLETYPGFHAAMFHLCGSFPDIFNELCFGRERDGSMGWTHHYVGEAIPGQSAWAVAAAFGNEHDQFYEIKLEHVASTEQSRAWLRVDSTWKEIGEAQPVIMSTAKVELKVNVPAKDAEVECYFDDCRMYPRPETHPVRFVVFASDVGKTNIEGVKLELFLNDGQEPIATGVTDAFGRVSLRLPGDADYPASARVRITLTDGATWEERIRQHDVEGLYPDSVWVARLNGREIAGEAEWWRDVLKPAR